MGSRRPNHPIFDLAMNLADNLVFSARVNKSDGREMPGPATLRNKATDEF